uniref:Cytoplasmic dynein 2 light intermediate chain 1 n=1 Tax=Mesocestoides corti TaxID=53468 RepID=A0A5K3EIL7_MESCO
MTQSLWDLAVKQSHLRLSKTRFRESYVVFAGCQTCGKSTIINSFLEKDETSRKTLALEYTFGRRSRVPYAPKSIVHVWELGGGVKFSHLLDVTVSRDSVENLCFVVVLDLSVPQELWTHLTHLLTAYGARIQNVLKNVSLKFDSSFERTVINRTLQRLNSDHPDHELRTVFPIPLVIIGSKYDLFLKFKSEDQELISKSLRFVANLYGSALFFANASDVAITKKIKSYLYHLAFEFAKPNSTPVFENGPLNILPGQDSFSLIGPPPTGSAVKRSNDCTLLELWESVFCKRFLQVHLLLQHFIVSLFLLIKTKVHCWTRSIGDTRK